MMTTGEAVNALGFFLRGVFSFSYSCRHHQEAKMYVLDSVRYGVVLGFPWENFEKISTNLNGSIFYKSKKMSEMVFLP
jgi:hypothetical protein